MKSYMKKIWFKNIINMKNKISNIKLVMTDIDGVWTDGGMYYDQLGNELKKFNTADSFGVILCHKLSIPVAIITGEDTEIVKKRAAKLNIDYVYQNAKNKLQIANTLCKQLNIDLSQVAYIGDDIGDYELLQSVGVSAAPRNASKYVKKIVDYKCKKCGGDGAFREFIETLYGKKNMKRYFNKI